MLALNGCPAASEDVRSCSFPQHDALVGEPQFSECDLGACEAVILMQQKTSSLGPTSHLRQAAILSAAANNGCQKNERCKRRRAAPPAFGCWGTSRSRSRPTAPPPAYSKQRCNASVCQAGVHDNKHETEARTATTAASSSSLESFNRRRKVVAVIFLWRVHNLRACNMALSTLLSPHSGRSYGCSSHNCRSPPTNSASYSKIETEKRKETQANAQEKNRERKRQREEEKER